MKPQESFDDVLEDLTRMSFTLGPLLSRIHAGRDGSPGAQRYDTGGTSGHTTVKFCERHQDDKCDCGESTTYPAVSDPTGETAVRLAGHHDAARRDIARYHDAIRLVRKGRETLLKLHDEWMPHGASSMDQSKADEPEPGCESCARLPAPSGVAGAKRWEPPTTKNPSKTTGSLLCWFCERWHRRTGHIPPVNVVKDHHNGKRINWPGESRRSA